MTDENSTAPAISESDVRRLAELAQVPETSIGRLCEGGRDLHSCRRDDDAAEMPLYRMATVHLRVTPEHMRPPVQRQPHALRVRCHRWTAAQAWTLRRLTAQQKRSRQYLALPMPRRPTARQPV
jgi:hypothetical protein